MPKGTAMEMLTPRDDTNTKSPSLFIEPPSLTNLQEQVTRAARFHHPIGVHRITAARLLMPHDYQPNVQLAYLEKWNLVGLQQADT